MGPPSHLGLACDRGVSFHDGPGCWKASSRLQSPAEPVVRGPVLPGLPFLRVLDGLIGCLVDAAKREDHRQQECRCRYLQRISESRRRER